MKQELGINEAMRRLLGAAPKEAQANCRLLDADRELTGLEKAQLRQEIERSK